MKRFEDQIDDLTKRSEQQRLAFRGSNHGAEMPDEAAVFLCGFVAIAVMCFTSRYLLGRPPPAAQSRDR